ncbi:alpha,alpha-phosphotrehalase [Pseudoflavonifractor capillosus ATCC 29799]|uniref:Alpha,alpha-phosphotrehalase n=1 Tax=Pseudoflavonifractor capillosus ATCC 29799 TaxID=411467 RepID=A6NSB5_9FIRM|nr:alpha,alpha-phosphotrehalase [Pseudoflavonifractor capillosus]EDN01153.1 alpha,alpha-phosphotrehalase [Pseudoflavonifractor capillosus ATCC 29799]
MQDFKKSVVYQIYPKSFLDTNGDGLGDLQGVISKLDYLQTLGVDYIWLTPFFVSPQNDNGYDVADYRAIDPRYGTMADFEDLVEEAGRRNIRVMLDMVFNHTSTYHQWFQKALEGDSVYQDYYIFRPGKADGSAPTNWESKFGGSAWEYVPSLGKYYLHLFDKTQADLNWENPAVRREVADIVRFWMVKGVKGFRFDVVNLISKGEYADDFQGDGRRFYTDGPRIHEFLKELNRESFGQDSEIITVGEMSSTSMENCFQYAGEQSGELSMVFSFHHLKVDFMGNEKWVIVPTDFGKLKDILFSWQEGMAAHSAWNAVFWCNHDQPRVVSRFGDEGEYWQQSAKMLASIVHGMRGTPYVYQGEELGMTNAGFTRLDQYRDVESLNHFRILRDKGLSEESVYNILKIHSRDNSRTPMQWDATPNGGFTTGEPWLSVNPNTARINAAAQTGDPDSIFSYYQALIRLRKEYDVFALGDFAPLTPEHPSVLAYRRRWNGETLLCVNNFFRKECTWTCPESLEGFRVLLSNYPDSDPAQVWNLRPYESVLLLKQN